jgi:pyrroline-5-carboxylate reductase
VARLLCSAVELAIVGGGRMGEALVGGLLAHGRGAGDIVVVEVSPERRAELGRSYPGLTVTDRLGDLPADVVLAVKPPDVPGAAAGAVSAGARRLLSIAAGVSTAAIEAAIGAAGGPVRVLRAMPNTPAQVGAGAAAVCAGSSAGPADLDWAESILAAVGTVVRVPEDLIDAVTGVSGSGPAYVFLVAEALIEAGVAVGLSRPVSRDLTVQTLLGSARLLSESGQDPQDLRAAVTSKGGTTAAAIAVLEERGVRQALAAAVAAAVARSKELGL